MTLSSHSVRAPRSRSIPCDIAISVEDARHLAPHAKHLLTSVMGIRVRADEVRFVHEDVRHLLVRQGNWYVAELPATQSEHLVPLFQGFLRGAVTFGIRLRASERQLRHIRTICPFLIDILETVMNATQPMSLTALGTFVACPSPHPAGTAPAKTRAKAKQQLGRPRRTGWVSPCCPPVKGVK